MLFDESQRQILLNGLRDMPDGDHLGHGDFHPRNVLGEPVAAHRDRLAQCLLR
jgi:hypothetical protein